MNFGGSMENLNWKKTVLLSLPIVFAVCLAVTLAACMAQAGKGPNDSALDGVETTDPSVQVVLPMSSQGLQFKSLGDGSCELIAETKATCCLPNRRLKSSLTLR